MKEMLYHFFPQIGVTDYSAHGFEACEVFCDFCRDKLGDDENVKIHHLAINDKNEDVKLYYAKNALGNSIYKSKNKPYEPRLMDEQGTVALDAPGFLIDTKNVNHIQKFFLNHGFEILKYCVDFKNNSIGDFEIAKAGEQKRHEVTKGIVFSEWLKNNVPDFKECFNILKINIEGAEYVFFKDIIENNLLEHFDVLCGTGHDIEKVPELSNKVEEYKRMLDENGVKIYRFTDWKPEKNDPLDKIILEKLRIKMMSKGEQCTFQRT